MFDKDNFQQSYGSTAKQDGVTVTRSPCCVGVTFKVIGFSKDDIKVSVETDGLITVTAKNEQGEKNYSILVGGITVPEKRVSLLNGELSLTFAKAPRKSLTIH